MCPRAIGCCPDSHLRKTRSSCGPAPAKPRCTVTNKLETLHTPLSALCSHSGQRSFFSSPKKSSRNGGRKQRNQAIGENQGAGTCLARVLSPVVTRLLQAAVATRSRDCLSSISACRWSAQTLGDRRALCLQRQRGPPPLEPETLRSSRRGKIVPGSADDSLSKCIPQ